MPIDTLAPPRRGHALRRRPGGKRVPRLRRTVLTLAGLGLSATLAAPALAAPVGVTASATARVVAWGYGGSGMSLVPEAPAGQTFTDIAAGAIHSMALTSSGQIIAWGDNSYNQTTVPSLPAGQTYTAVAAGNLSSIALTSTGEVKTWGDDYGQSNVPPAPAGQRYTAISTGGFHSLALTSDGQVIAWGSSSLGQTTVPTLPAGQTYVAISAGNGFSMALTSTGQAVTWGSSFAPRLPPPPAGQTYTAIAGNSSHALGLTSAGQVIAAGYNHQGQLDVPTLPDGETYTALATGVDSSLALTSTGRAVGWGFNHLGQTNVPALPAGQIYTAIAAGGYHSLALASELLQAPAITGTPPSAVVGQTYSHAFSATGNPAPTVAVTSGELPAGLTLSEDGVLSGTPITAGKSSFTVTATNSVDTSSLDVELEVAAAPAAPAFADTVQVTLEGVVGAELTRQFEVTGNPAPVITVSDPEALPPGMTFVDGVLAGTPSAAGTYGFTLVATNGVDPDVELGVTVTVTDAPRVPGAPGTSLFGSLAPILGFSS